MGREKRRKKYLTYTCAIHIYTLVSRRVTNRPDGGAVRSGRWKKGRLVNPDRRGNAGRDGERGVGRVSEEKLDGSEVTKKEGKRRRERRERNV